MNAYGLPAMGMTTGVPSYPMFPGHQLPQHMMMMMVPQPSPTAAAVAAAAAAAAAAAGSNRAPTGPKMNDWVIHVPMGPTPPAAPASSSVAAAAAPGTQPVLLRVRQVLATLDMRPPPGRMLGKKTTPGSLGWEDLLKRHFHVVQPQAATHYMPDGHPARTVAFGDFGCVAHIYPSGRVEAYGQDTSEVAVRETATKASQLTGLVLGSALTCTEPAVETMTVAVPSCPVLKAALARDPLLFDKLALRWGGGGTAAAAAATDAGATAAAGAATHQQQHHGHQAAAIWAPEAAPLLALKLPRTGGAMALAFESSSVVFTGVRSRQAAEAAYAVFRSRYLYPMLAAPEPGKAAGSAAATAAGATPAQGAAATAAGGSTTAAGAESSAAAAGAADEGEDDEDEEGEDDDDGAGEGAGGDEEDGEEGDDGEEDDDEATATTAQREEAMLAAFAARGPRKSGRARKSALPAGAGGGEDDVDDEDGDAGGGGRKKARRGAGAGDDE